MMSVAEMNRLTLNASTAAELMMPNPLSIRDSVLVREAVAFLTDKGISAAPVIDEAGRPLGVVSRADIVVHDREQAAHVKTPGYYETEAGRVPPGFQVEDVDRTPVRDIMTPVVFSVRPDSPAATVISEMLELKVHRLFVVDEDGVLTGVISALDVLRHLMPNEKAARKVRRK
ncbi:MAG: CBS domain-containing protein [Gemmataceae bacterium]